MNFFICVAMVFIFMLPTPSRSDDSASLPLKMVPIHAATQNTWDRLPWMSPAKYPGPPCQTDIYEHFSVNKAMEYINQLDALVQREGYAAGRRWDYPALGTAENLIYLAELQLEQVMNQGILRLIPECVTCYPEDYLTAARQLIILGRKVYGEPEGRRNYNLVESVIYWLAPYGPKTYCGEYVKQTTPPGDLIGDWEFGRDTSSSPICHLSLTTAKGDHGRIVKNCTYEASYYWSLGNTLVFVNPLGKIKSILEKYIPSQPIAETYYFGSSYPDDTSGLYLFSTCPGTVIRGSLEWQRCDDGNQYSAPSSYDHLEQYYSARNYCQDLELNGSTDWRLPTLEELRDLVYCSTGRKYAWTGSPCNDDSDKPTIYPEFEARYDNSTSYITISNSQSDNADGWYYHIYFGDGDEDDYSASRSFYVRCVRDM